MKLDLEMAEPAPVPTADDPFARGWRHTDRRDGQWRVPLAEDDLLYPQEGDFVVNNAAHNDDREHLVAVFRERTVGKDGIRVFGDHLIDFGVEGMPNLGPDVIVLNGEPRPWNRNVAVFPVKAMGARPLIVVELTSPTTRKKDLAEKPGLFYRAGVPIYVLIDLFYGGGKNPGGIVAYQAGPTGYEDLPPEPNGWVWLEVVEVFLAAEDDRIVCYDRDRQRIGNYTELCLQRRAALSVASTARTEAETARDAEKVRADAERQRADAAERKTLELEAELKRLRGDTH